MIAEQCCWHRRDLDAAGLQREDRRAVADMAVNHLGLNRDDRHEAASSFAVMTAALPAIRQTFFALLRAMRGLWPWRRRVNRVDRCRPRQVPPRGR